MDKQAFLEASEDYFAGAFELISKDLPDGAWFQAHVDMAGLILDDICEWMDVDKPDVDGTEIAQHYFASIYFDNSETKN